MKLFKIDAGNFMVDGGALFGVIPKIMWRKHYASDADNYCALSMRCLLIDDGERRVLIDTGAGMKQSSKFYSHYRYNEDGQLLDSLKSVGYQPEDITDVVLTHLHWDHCGGCVYRDENNSLHIQFKNAIHWVSQAQWDNYKQPNPREGAVYFTENMMPIYENGMLKTIKDNGFILPNIEAKLFSGHTSGNMLPIIHTPAGQIAFMGDLIPVQANIKVPWVSAYDTMPLTSIDEKKQFINHALNNDITLFFEHDINIECCKLFKNDNGIGVSKGFKLRSLSFG